MTRQPLGVIVAVLACLGYGSPGLSQPTGLETKSIDLYIGYAPGGGYDTYGRLVARHLGKHLPGQPVVIPRNMPGAGSITAANFIFSRAPKDGTALGIVTQTIKEEELLDTPGVAYKAEMFTWIGRIAPNVNVSVTWHTSKAKSIADARGVDVPVASNIIAGVLPTVLNNTVGTRFKLINGYAGSNEGMLAMERGETDGAMTTWDTLKASKQDWLRDRKVNILVQYTAERHRDMPDVPTMVELGTGEEERHILELFAAASVIGRSLMAPPGLSAERTAALRKAFQAMVADPDFLSDAEKIRLDVDPLSGERLQAMIEAVKPISVTLRNRAREARGLAN